MCSLHSGQVCAAGSRIFVQETIYDKFVETFKGIAASFKRGDGFDPTTTQTAVVSKVQLDVRLPFCYLPSQT